MLKIGVLLPNASNYPYLTNHYTSGLQLALNKLGLEHQIYFESAGNGAREEVILEKAQKLFIQSGIHVLVAYAGNRMAKALLNIAEANRRMLYFSNLGDSHNPNLNSPYLISNTFGLWQSAWLSGWHLGKKKAGAWVVSGFYESGFKFANAFERGLTAGGGEILGYKIMQGLWDEGSMIELMEKAEGADAVFACVSNPDAEGFLKQYSQHKKGISLIGGGITHLSQLSEEAKPLSMEGHVSWSEELNSKINKDFITDYKAENQEQPSLFSQMGHEAGLILAKQQELGAFDQRSGFVKEGFKLDSSRGTLCFHDGNQNVQVPQYYYKMNKAALPAKGESSFEAIAPQDLLLEDMKKQDNSDTGWVNLYPCD